MIRVQKEIFDIGAELSALTRGRTHIGGLASFVGLVRDFAPRPAETAPEAGTQAAGGNNAEIRAMTLEHYPGMTERMLERIDNEAQSRWALDATLIIHRYGRMLPGEPIVLVACAAAHREPALDACAFLIDWLKTRAPFWKLEESPDAASWVDARDSDETRAARWTRPRSS